jgi:hypothetical protein
MRRFSVRSLMVLIVGAAVGLTALRNANALWASATATVVAVTVATSLTAALTLRGRERYAGTGVYLAVAVYPLLANYFAPSLAVEYARSNLSGDQARSLEDQRETYLRVLAMLIKKSPASVKIQDLIADLDEALQKERANRWHSWLPGAANTNEFRCVGHSLFALLWGLIGSVVGKFFYARRKRSETQTPWRHLHVACRQCTEFRFTGGTP